AAAEPAADLDLARRRERTAPGRLLPRRHRLLQRRSGIRHATRPDRRGAAALLDLLHRPRCVCRSMTRFHAGLAGFAFPTVMRRRILAGFACLAFPLLGAMLASGCRDRTAP